MKGNENTDCFHILFSTSDNDVKHNNRPNSLFINQIQSDYYAQNNSL